MTQRFTTNVNPASKSGADRDFALPSTQRTGVTLLTQPKPVSNSEANKENIPNYNPQASVLRPLAKLAPRPVETAPPANKKQKVTSQPAAKSKPAAPPTQPKVANKQQHVQVPPLTVNKPAESIPRPESRLSVEDKAPELDAVRQRIHDIKRAVRELETEREQKLDEQWRLFLETAALQEKKLKLRESAAATYHQLEVKIFELKKEYTTLMTRERALNEHVLEHDC